MRLLTRSDFDGLACAVLLKVAGVIDDLKFVHPKDVQDGLVEVTENDVLANIPYAPGCGLWFDHHSSEKERGSLAGAFRGESRPAPSCARVIYDYYGGPAKFSHLEGMMAAVDKSDSGQLTREEILNPTEWVLLSFITDPRTGLGRFRDYRISNYQLMEELIDLCATGNIVMILGLPDVEQRADRYYEQMDLFREMLMEHTEIHGNVIVTDLRGLETIYAGNRFLVYALFPEQNVSIQVMDGKNKQNCVLACGHSILNRTSKTDIGSLMLAHGGGGHRQVGTCQVPYEDADRVLAELIARMKADG